jgi:hypothetical protein
MAVSANALNMAQYAILSNDPLVQSVTFSLIDNGAVMARDIPFATKQSLIAAGVRWEGNLPSVTWANLNEEGTVVTGTPTPYQEQAYTLRNYIDTDKVYVQDQNQIINPRSAQLAAYLKAQAYDFNHKFIKNDHVTGDAKAIVGLRFRIDNGSTFGVRSENKINSSAVDLTQAAATAATFANFLEFVDQLLWSVDSPEGTGVVLYMNDVLLRRWASLAARFAGQGGFGQAVDQMGRSVMRYKNAELRDIGYKADQSTRIVTVTEAANGVADTGSTHTSIYAVNYGTEHLMGWQFEALQARDLGLMENGIIYRTFIDWTGGLINMSTRSIGRLYGIKLS